MIFYNEPDEDNESKTMSGKLKRERGFKFSFKKLT